MSCFGIRFATGMVNRLAAGTRSYDDGKLGGVSKRRLREAVHTRDKDESGGRN